MFKAVYILFMLFGIGIGIGIAVRAWIGTWVALKGYKGRVIGGSSRGCYLLYIVMLFKFFN